jgi:hypothetical protein
MPAIKRASHRIDLSASDRIALAGAHTCHDAAALLVRLAPSSAQAQRLARALIAVRDHLWPLDGDRDERAARYPREIDTSGMRMTELRAPLKLHERPLACEAPTWLAQHDGPTFTLVREVYSDAVRTFCAVASQRDIAAALAKVRAVRTTLEQAAARDHWGDLQMMREPLARCRATLDRIETALRRAEEAANERKE